jgi:hypothetical protein
MNNDLPSRYFYNDDGDRGVFLIKGPFHPRQLEYAVDVLVGTPVTTLVYCSHFGSDMAYYPSKVSSALDWRWVENHDRNDPYTYFRRVHQIGKYLRENHIDLLAAVKRRAEQLGLEFVPSLRMNDVHFCNNVIPTEHPTTGEFWMKNQDLVIGPEVKWKREDLSTWYSKALDFTHEKVREYRMAQAFEVIDGYASDGFEMDFTRNPLFFPPGKAKPELITDMVARARKRLNEAGRKGNKKLFLMVRVPGDMGLCTSVGLDVPRWMNDRLVDYVVVCSTNARYFSFDIPLEPWIKAAGDRGCRIIASPDSYKATSAIYRAGFANYYAMGQKDTYLFNFFTSRAETREYYPFRDEDYALFRDLKNPVTLFGRPKHFFAEGTFQLGRTYPISRQTGGKTDIRMYVGDDLKACREAMILKQAMLKLVLSGRKAEDKLVLKLNGQPLPMDRTQVQNDQIVLDLAGKDLPLPQMGWNTITIEFQSESPDAQAVVTSAELMTEYDLTGV